MSGKPAFPVQKDARSSVWDKGDRGQGENPALTFIQETRWVAQDPAASPEAKQGWRPTTWPCFALSCSLSPRILLAATKAQAGGALGDWTLLLIH